MSFVKSCLVLFLLTSLLFSQSREELRRALSSCEADLEASLQKIEALNKALKSTDQMVKERQQIVDSLVQNLQQQITIQAQISARLQMNADTLQLMVQDYQHKLDEVADLYRKELEKSSRPWILTKHGLQGFTTGLLVGGAMGLIYGLLH